jgi:hypothetical protein
MAPITPIKTTPPGVEPSREEARAQFDHWTRALGLKHTFSFDEMYSIGLELRRRKDYRAKVTDFEDRIRQIDGALVGNCFPLVHKFADGLYIRQITVPAQTLTVTKIHAQTHPFFILRGTVSILTEAGVARHTAPYSGITQAGTKRVIWHHDEVVLTTVHRTDNTDIAKIEAEVTAADFNALPDSLDQARILEFVNSIQG